MIACAGSRSYTSPLLASAWTAVAIGSAGSLS